MALRTRDRGGDDEGGAGLLQAEAGNDDRGHPDRRGGDDPGHQQPEEAQTGLRRLPARVLVVRGDRGFGGHLSEATYASAPLIIPIG